MFGVARVRLSKAIKTGNTCTRVTYMYRACECIFSKRLSKRLSSLSFGIMTAQLSPHNLELVRWTISSRMNVAPRHPLLCFAYHCIKSLILSKHGEHQVGKVYYTQTLTRQVWDDTCATDRDILEDTSNVTHVKSLRQIGLSFVQPFLPNWRRYRID